MYVALESTVIAHGLPRPQNLECAFACERAVRESGAAAETVAVIAGRPAVGLTEAELRELATRDDIEKVSLRNLGVVVSRGLWGATTVGATLHIVERTGISVFSTGGIGGVHREGGSAMDVSADLTALATKPVVTVCSGAKSVLDLPRTMEVLETLGIPVIGYGTDELPAFYSRSSGLPVTARADTAEEVAEIASAHWSLGLRSALLVTVPCPQAEAIPSDEINGIVEAALEEAGRLGVAGPAVTPFLLRSVAKRTKGRALRANLALLENNARIAGRIAVALSAVEGIASGTPFRTMRTSHP